MPPEIDLYGCRSTPLSGCLKSIGVFRIVATQADQASAGFWRDGHFVLDSSLNEEDLMDFLCNRYSPTPVMNPWNGGSGFWPNDNKTGINRILETEDARFKPYADAIRTVRALPLFECGLDSVQNLLSAARKVDSSGKSNADFTKSADQLERIASELPIPISSLTKQAVEDLVESGPSESRKAVIQLKKEFSKLRNKLVGADRSSEKEAMLLACRAALPEEALPWLDAAIAIRGDGTPAYNPVLGSGGNDGRNDFSKNFMEAVTDLLLGSQGECRALLRGSLFRTSVTGFMQGNIGHFDPGRAGGYNQGQGPGIDSGMRPSSWDFVLTLEGATLLASSVSRRSATGTRGNATLPFTVDLSAYGFASAQSSEKGKSELWFPIWENPATLDEIAYLFAEGRGNLNRRTARNGLEFCRAVGLLGVERGISSFVRYAFISERRGKSNVAMPVGEHSVKFVPRLALLGEFDTIRSNWRTSASGIRSLSGRFDDVDREMFSCASSPSADSFTRVIRALGRLNLALSRMDKQAKDFPRFRNPLSPNWLEACRHTPELRMAAAISTIYGKNDTVLRNLLCVKDGKWDSRASDWRGPDLISRMCSVLSRRLIDAEAKREDTLPLQSRLHAFPEDAALLMLGGLNVELMEELIFGFCFVDWRSLSENPFQAEERPSIPIPRSYALLKLCFTPRLFQTNTGNPREISNLLAAGRTRDALRKANNALRVKGWTPFEMDFAVPDNGKSILAALLVPIKSMWSLKKMVIKETRNQEVV